MHIDLVYKKRKDGKIGIALYTEAELDRTELLEFDKQQDADPNYVCALPPKDATALLKWLRQQGYDVVKRLHQELVTNIIHNAACLDKLKELPNASIDLICTDPPYGLTSVDPKRPGGGKGKSGFMGKKWDKAVPPVEVWQECLRVLKPGAFAFILCSPRQDCLARMILNLEEAGFVTGFSSLYHIYASGFPKATNLSKQADKRAGAEREVVGPRVRVDGKSPEKKFSGYQGHIKTTSLSTTVTAPATKEAVQLNGAFAGWQPKPAIEPVLVAMKPIEQKTYLDQALDNGKGCTWLDDGRIPTSNEDAQAMERANTPGSGRYRKDRFHTTTKTAGKMDAPGAMATDLGRFPANVLVENGALNNGSMSRSPATYRRNAPGFNQTAYGKGMGQETGAVSQNFGDSGSFSRYFDLDAWWTKRISKLPEQVQKVFPFLLVPKASRSEKNSGLEGMPKKAKPEIGEFKENPGRNTPKSSLTPRANTHPTVKPLKLMSYLITIGSRPGDVVLDPYCGSGTTCCAAKAAGRKYIGIELDEEYVEIAERRVKATLPALLAQRL